MARVPVPEDYGRGVVTVAGTHDHLYGEADVNLDDVRHARHLKVNEATDGTLGVPEQYAEDVAAFLGTIVETDSTTSDEAVEEPSTRDSDVVEDDSTTDGDVVEGDVETCQVEKADGEICERTLPCPYHSEDDEADE